MPTKSTLKDIQTILDTKLANLCLPSQIILRYRRLGISVLKCAVHGRYELTGKPLIRYINDRRSPCPACTKERFDAGHRPKRTESRAAIKKWIESGGLKLRSNLSETVVLTATTLKLECLLCGSCFSIGAFKFSTWRHSTSSRGCAECRIRKPRFQSHKEYALALDKVHSGEIKPLFKWGPFKYKRGDKDWFGCSHGHTWRTRVMLPIRGYGCRHCAVIKNQKRGPNVIKVKLSGKEFTLDSKSELTVLRKLLEIYEAKDIDREPYPIPLYGGKNYYPDFLIKSRKILLEVKSTATLGLTYWTRDRNRNDVLSRFENTKQKFITAFALGYNIRLVVGTAPRKDEHKPLTILPEDWFTWTWKEVASFLRKKGHPIPLLARSTSSKHSR